MPIPVGLAIGAAVVGGGLQMMSAKSTADQNRSNQQKVIDQQYKQAVALDNYNWDTSLREYDYRLDEVAIQRLNNENNALAQDYQNLQNWQDAVLKQDFEYANRIREYSVSEAMFGARSQLNRLALQQSVKNENAKYEEALRTMAFDQEGDYFDFLEAQGQAQNNSFSGAQAAANLGKNLAQYGRNLRVKEAELMSTQSARERSLSTIKQRYVQAQITAFSQRNLKPIKGPRPSAPLMTPRAVFQDPQAPVRGPKPVKGVNAAPRYSVFNAANDFVSGAKSAVSFANQFYPA